MRCEVCLRSFVSGKSGCVEWKRNHRCPPGTAGAAPVCPECRATGKHCKTPAGSPMRVWHPGRIDVAVLEQRRLRSENEGLTR